MISQQDGHLLAYVIVVFGDPGKHASDPDMTRSAPSSPTSRKIESSHHGRVSDHSLDSHGYATLVIDRDLCAIGMTTPATTPAKRASPQPCSERGDPTWFGIQ